MRYGSEKRENLKNYIVNQNWDEASGIKEGDMQKDMIQFYLLKCTTNDYALVTYLSIFELWEDDYVSEIEIISKDQYNKLNKLVKNRWIKI